MMINEKCKDPNVRAFAMVTEVNIWDNDEVKIADGLMLTIYSSDGDYNKVIEVFC